MHSLYLRIWQWILPLILLVGCSRPVALEHDRLKPIHFGKPEVQGGILTIPVLTNDGHGFAEPTGYLCKVESALIGLTITVKLYRCGIWPKVNDRDIPHLSNPTISVPYTGPNQYQIKLIDHDNRSTELGIVNVTALAPTPKN